jgi:cyclophilin family peptidyl-prolyl cis-trans isomerase
MKLIVIGVIVIVVIVVGFFIFKDEAEQIEEKNEDINLRETIVVILNTNKGVITLELYKNKTPKTVENFVKLAEDSFYDGTKFHRIIENFMIQGGDPLSKDDSKQMLWGTGGPGYNFEDEIVEELSNITGTISMANAGPNTNGSQFFINVADNTFLDGKHSVFGKVTKGMETVLEISKLPKNERDVPNEPIIIESVDILD